MPGLIFGFRGFGFYEYCCNERDERPSRGGNERDGRPSSGDTQMANLRSGQATLLQLMAPEVKKTQPKDKPGLGIKRGDSYGTFSPIIFLKNPLKDRGERIIRLVSQHGDKKELEMDHGWTSFRAETLPSDWRKLCEEVLSHARDALTTAPFSSACKTQCKGSKQDRQHVAKEFSNNRITWVNLHGDDYACGRIFRAGYHLPVHIDIADRKLKRFNIMFTIGNTCIYHCGTRPDPNDFQFKFECGDVLIFDRASDFHGIRKVLEESTCASPPPWLKSVRQSVIVTFRTNLLDTYVNPKNRKDQITFDPKTGKANLTPDDAHGIACTRK